MTKFNNYVPQAPKTYEVRYVEVKEPSKISTMIAGYLGLKTVENCFHPEPIKMHAVYNEDGTVKYYTSDAGDALSKNSSSSISSTKSTQAQVVSSAITTTSVVGGSVDIKTNTDGSTNIKYDSGKSTK